MKTLSQLQKIIKQAQGTVGTTAYRPKGGDEQKFMDKHIIQHTDDANGNDDAMFKGTGVKTVDREKERHGYDAEKAAAVHEETEELDEISKSTLGSYVKKASIDMANRSAEVEKDLATAKSDYSMHRSHGFKKKTAQNMMKKDIDTALSKVSKTSKRMSGIEKATDRLTKEEVEELEIDERTLSTGEMKKREDIVKGMKKGLKDFKKRYGADAKSVMYATATKMAKEDVEYDIQMLELFASLDEENKQFMIEMLDKGLEKEILEYIKESESDNG